jgi:hypothetical protein
MTRTEAHVLDTDRSLDVFDSAAPRSLALLRAGVPLTLLLDLALPLDSDALMRDEPADTSWVPHAVA